MSNPVIKANSVLVLVTLIWGLTFPLIKLALAHVSPSTFTLFRFIFAALFFLPLLGFSLFNVNKSLLWVSLILAILNSGVYFSQAIGLQTITPSRSAFITGINVLLVPFLLPLFRLGRPTVVDIISTVCAFFGLYILTGASLKHLVIGDLWTLITAIFYALSIVVIQRLTPKVKNSYLLSFYQILFALPLLFGLTLADHTPSSWWHIHVIIALLFCSLCATVLSFYLQMQYQKQTTATQAALIYCLEPVFAAIFSHFISNDRISKQTLLGGCIILVSLVLPIIYRTLLKQRKLRHSKTI
ncbi:MAG: DMT family transporter [Pseudomonadota bacterium]